jgi:molybdate transport system substrate-binding protein
MPFRWLLLTALSMLWPVSALAEAVRVAAAISLKEAMTEVAAAYKSAGRGEVEFTFGSSGQLQAQIEYGAPVDVFISAAHKQVDELVAAKVADGTSKRVVAGNRLVLIVPAGAKSRVKSFTALTDATVKRVAIGQPKTVPAGQYAQQVFQRLGLLDGLRDRLVYGASVRQVLDYVARGEVDAGIVYETDAKEAGDTVRVVATAEEGWHEPILYSVATVSASRHKADVKAFTAFLQSDAARAIFATRGFTEPPTTGPAAPAADK